MAPRDAPPSSSRAIAVELFVRGRDYTKLVAGIHTQMSLVGTALGASRSHKTPLEEMLCFVEGDAADRGLVHDRRSAHAGAATKLLIRPGSLGEAQRRTFNRNLTAAFPPA